MLPITVLLVDDHQVVREGLRRMLELEDDIRVIGEAANMEEALHLAELHSPDVILMDIKMPGGDGVEATRRLKGKLSTCHIIMLTLYEEYIAEAIEAGAVGYLLKDVKREELSQAIRVAYQGQSPLDASLTRKLVGEFASLAKEKARPQPGLSERQLGAAHAEIAVRRRLVPSVCENLCGAVCPRQRGNRGFQFRYRGVERTEDIRLFPV